MDNLDDFNFDDTDLSGFGSDEDTQEQSSDSGINEFENNVQLAETSGDKRQVIKQAAIIAIVGIVIILLTFTLVRALKSSSNKSKVNTNQTNTVQSSQTVNTTSSSGWTSVAADTELQFNEDYIQTDFQISSIQHYVKVVDSNNNLEIKTVLTGTLKGFLGTYELEVPYSIGSQLKVENAFKVEVQVGEYKGKSVVGEIKY